MNWLNLWRAGIFIVCLTSFIILCLRFAKYRQRWNGKTRDYWYALTMWSLAGMVLSVEGMVRHAAFGVRLVFISAAALVTLSGLNRKGNWGMEQDERK